jgi:hypothetical protein
MVADGLTGEGESEAHAFLLARGGEGLEQARVEVFGEAGAGVGDRENHALVAGFGCDGDPAAGRHGFDGVDEKVLEDSLKARALQLEDQVSREVGQDFDVVAIRFRSDDRVRGLDDLTEPAGLRRASPAAGDIGEIAEQFMDAAGGAIDITGEPLDLLRREITVDEHL